MLKQFIRIVTLVSVYSQPLIVQAADTYEVQALYLKKVVTLSGTVIPRKEVTLAAQLPGRVEMLAGEEGESFKKGMVLVSIDATELKAKRREVYAAMMNADAMLRNAGLQYERELWSPDSPDKAPGGMGLPHLFDQFFTKPMSDIIGESNKTLDRRAQLNSYETQIEQARSALLQAESQLDQIDAKLRDSLSKSPFQGVIVKKMIEVGDTVQPGQPLLEFADMAHLQLEANVPARLIPGLDVGDQTTAKLDVLDQRIAVEIARIFPTADPQRHTVTVKFDLRTALDSEVTQYINPGQYVQIDIPDKKATTEQKSLIIPQRAVIQRGGLPSVYVITEDKRELRLVRLGREVSASEIEALSTSEPLGDFVSVLSGLKPQEIIELPSK